MPCERKRKDCPGTEDNHPKQRPLSACNVTLLTGTSPNITAWSPPQTSSQPSSEPLNSPYAATSATSDQDPRSMRASMLPRISAGSHGLSRISLSDRIALASAGEGSDFMRTTHHKAAVPALNYLPSISDATYSGTSHTLFQSQGPADFHNPTGQANLRGNPLQPFQDTVAALGLASDPQITLLSGLHGRAESMTDSMLLQGRHSSPPGGSSEFEPSPYHRTASVPSNQTSDWIPGPCYVCQGSQNTGHTSGSVFHTGNDYIVHLWKAHPESLEWREQKCLWAGCRTQKTFASVNLWLAHVKIVHQKSFYCTLEGCQFRKAFGAQADLDRHYLSKTHSNPVYCDKPGCIGRDNLNRRDKQNKHNREYHGQFLCQVAGCPRGQHVAGVSYGFATAKDLTAHQMEKHQVGILLKNLFLQIPVPTAWPLWTCPCPRNDLCTPKDQLSLSHAAFQTCRSFLHPLASLQASAQTKRYHDSHSRRVRQHDHFSISRLLDLVFSLGFNHRRNKITEKTLPTIKKKFK